MDMKRRIVVLSGAGISADSGLKTFRDSDGLWEGHRVDQVATPEAFARNPQLVIDFYNARRRQLLEAQPNAAHHALARLADHYDVRIVTQNVDDLHERAGSPEVLHMHGSLLALRCLYCDSVVDNWHDDCSRETACPTCKRTGGMRPDIVWFGEMPYYMETIEARLAECTHFAAIGTSGHVYPAAGFAALARHYGAEISEINLEPSQGAAQFHHVYSGKATVEVPRWVDSMLN